MAKLQLPFFLVVLGFSSASVFRLQTEQSPLLKRIDKIADLIPITKIKLIIQSYVNNGDPEVIEIVQYVQSGQLQHLIEDMFNHPKVQEQIHELETKGIRVHKILEAIRNVINNNKDVINNISNITPPSVQHKVTIADNGNHKGVAELVKEILATLPVAEILPELLNMYLLTEEVHIIYEHLRRRECYEIAREILEWQEVKTDLHRLKSWGVDVQGIIDALEGLLGWPISNEI